MSSREDDIDTQQRMYACISLREDFHYEEELWKGGRKQPTKVSRYGKMATNGFNAGQT